ncbi:MAG: hypothetical protein ACLGG5_07395 [Thermoleophilia bacterium]
MGKLVDTDRNLSVGREVLTNLFDGDPFLAPVAQSLCTTIDRLDLGGADRAGQSAQRVEKMRKTVAGDRLGGRRL